MGLIPEGPRCLRRALCSSELPAAVNHRHFKPWGWNEAALICYKAPACGSWENQTLLGLLCAPFQHKDGIWPLTGDPSPGRPGVSSRLCLSIKLNSVSDSASPLCQRWLCHPHLPPHWQNLPASFGTGSLARCAQALQNPSCPNSSVPGSPAVPLSALCRAVVAALPSRTTLSTWEGWGGGCSSRGLEPQHLKWLWASSTLQLPSERATSGQHATNTEIQDGKQPQNVVVLCFYAPATECYMKWKNYIKKN